MLAGDVVVPLEPLRRAPVRPVVARRPVPMRRWMRVSASIAVAAAVVAVLVIRPGNDPDVGTPPVTSSIELVMLPLDPPIHCELERCPSLAVSPEGTLVAYDQAANTLTWYDAERRVVPVTADLDAEHVQLVAIGQHEEIAYLLAGSPGTESWEVVEIAASGEELRRAASSSPDVEPGRFGLVERFCWRGCGSATRSVMSWTDGAVTYPYVTHTTGAVTVRLRELRWAIAWPHTLSTLSQVARRRDGGVVLSLVSESADVPSELVELLPDGTIQRFGLGDETVHVLLPDGSAVVWRDGQLVRLSPPQPAEPPPAWSAELTARPLDLPIACERSADPECPRLVVSPDGTLVAYDPAAATLTWYEDEPRVVPITAEFAGALVEIGPHDVVYFSNWSPPELIAIAPSGAEITRKSWSGGVNGYELRPTRSGLVETPCTYIEQLCTGGTEWPDPTSALAMPWVDLAGNPITDTRSYPTAKSTDAGIEVRLGEREWLLAEEWSDRPRPALFARSDGGVVVLLGTFDDDNRPHVLLELLPDGTVERYFGDSWPQAVLADGSLIVEQNLQLIHLTLPS